MMIRFKNVDIVVPVEMQIFCDEQYNHAVKIINEIEKQCDTVEQKREVLITMFPTLAGLWLTSIVHGDYNDELAIQVILEIKEQDEPSHEIMHIGLLFCIAVSIRMIKDLTLK